jgi:hypothetical protein
LAYSLIMKRTQSWLATKISNLFILKETGTHYLRVKPKGSPQTRIPGVIGGRSFTAYEISSVFVRAVIALRYDISYRFE